MFWWRKEIDEARARADRAEHEHRVATARRVEAERADDNAKRLESVLRPELVANGFTEALRAAFRGIA